MRKTKRWLGLILIVVFSTGFIQSDQDIYYRISKSIDTFGKIYKEISLNYVDEINPENFMLAGIKGMLNTLDPYTIYIDENQQQDIDVITKGKYGGIGATIGLRDGKVTVLDLLEGYSAQRQGLIIGDVLLKVDAVELTRDNYSELSSFLKGEPGTQVEVTVQREGVEDPIIFNLVREEVEVKNLTYYGFVPAGSNNAYMKLSGFSRTAGDEIRKAIIDLQNSKPVDSIVLDLRGNPGGLLDAAIDVAEKFVGRGELVVTVAGRDSSNIESYYSREEPVAGKSKLIVLIDGGSASASEIVAGAIQDHDRGVILGTHSFGKGLVQTLVPLSENTSLKITTGKYYTPSGRCIQKINYSEDNDVFVNHEKFLKKEYLTDSQRKVYAAGGILPDTVVTNSSDSKIIGELLARGMFFRFATNYFNLDKAKNYDNLPEDKLFDAFKKYLKENDFEFSSTSLKMLDELKSNLAEEGFDGEITQKVNLLIDDINKEKTKLLDDHKDEIVIEIREELAARTGGRKGRIEESLKYDTQFDSAVSFLMNSKNYNNLLNIDE